MIRAAEFAVGVQEPVVESIQNYSLAKEQIVAKFQLFEVEAMVAPQKVAFLGGKKGDEAIDPFSAAGNQILGGEAIGDALRRV